MNEKKEQLKKELKEAIANITEINALNEVKVEYLGKKGKITELSNTLREMSIEEKKEFGKLLNELKEESTTLIEEKRKQIEEKILNKKLESEKIDISLPAVTIPVGSPNILERMIEEVEEVFMSMGYDVVDGPEIEEDKYNFELLNIPKGHPARDAQDTFYIDLEYLLRISRRKKFYYVVKRVLCKSVRCCLKKEKRQFV